MKLYISVYTLVDNEALQTKIGAGDEPNKFGEKGFV